MGWLEVISVALWACTIGYYIGQSRGLERGRREQYVRIKCSDVKLTMEWTAIEGVLDQRGLIAMPKGMEFNGRKEPSCN